jgi:prepilin-type processing-associated H-X9-DG protein
VPYSTGGVNDDIDFTTQRLGFSTIIQTHVVVTSRSYHSGGANTLLMDGSVQFFRNSIARDTWRALGTRAGGEVIGDYRLTSRATIVDWRDVEAIGLGRC